MAQLEVLPAAGLVNAPLCPPRRLCGNEQSQVGEDPCEPPLNWVGVKDLQRNCGLCVTEKKPVSLCLLLVCHLTYLAGFQEQGAPGCPEGPQFPGAFPTFVGEHICPAVGCEP